MSIKPNLSASDIRPISNRFSVAEAGESTMPALSKQACKRPKQPQGDMMYRAAAVAAALMILATVAL